MDLLSSLFSLLLPCDCLRPFSLPSSIRCSRSDLEMCRISGSGAKSVHRGPSVTTFSWLRVFCRAGSPPSPPSLCLMLPVRHLPIAASPGSPGLPCALRCHLAFLSLKCRFCFGWEPMNVLHLCAKPGTSSWCTLPNLCSSEGILHRSVGSPGCRTGAGPSPNSVPRNPWQDFRPV